MDTNNLLIADIEKRLIDIMKNTEFFSLSLDKNAITPETSIINDLSLDSIQLLEYLVAIENNLELNMDYQDLSVEVFKNFHTLATYFYEKSKINTGETLSWKII